MRERTERNFPILKNYKENLQIEKVIGNRRETIRRLPTKHTLLNFENVKNKEQILKVYALYSSLSSTNHEVDRHQTFQQQH